MLEADLSLKLNLEQRAAQNMHHRLDNIDR